MKDRIFYYTTGLLHGEETVELGIDHVGDLLEVLGTITKLAVVAIDDDELSLVTLDPLLVATGESLEVVEAHGLLVLTATLLNLCHQGGNGGADVDHEVGQLDERHHEVEEVAIVVEVAVAHHALSVEIGCKDTGILEDGAVLDDGVGTLGNLDHLLEALVEEVDLQVERPPLHVGIEVLQVGVVVYGFESGGPSVTVGQHFGQRGLTTANVSCYCDMHTFESPQSGVWGLNKRLSDLIYNRFLL